MPYPLKLQEHIIGRRKVSDIELPEAEKPSYAHNVLTNIEENGEQIQILRDNMPFGKVGSGEFGTYFIGYARSPTRVEQMLQNMFVGSPRAITTGYWMSVPPWGRPVLHSHR
ncbi:Dyp-type peroxidase [Komagataeibacter rhaeticus]|nr:Dyp-type peroxidase [Komagataeibacter rhaeticus]